MNIPYNFEPRDYQKPFLEAMDSGIKRAVLVWHRRAGKDKTVLNMLIKKMFERVGTYYYVFPTYNQGRKVIWDGIDRDGFKFIDHFPKELVTAKNEAEMRIELINGSAFQVVGADKIDRIVGTNPIGCVFSEYSIMKPEGYEFLKPVLKENDGWAVFVFTPRGTNHGFNIFKMAQDNRFWFAQKLTIKDTGVLTEADMDEERKEGTPEDLIQQEYYCEFISGAGSYFKRIDENIWSGDMFPEQGNVYQLGVDLAKHHDYTVITPFNRNNFLVGKQERFNQIDWGYQKARIEAIYHKYYQNPIVMDVTGIGDPIYDDMNARGMGIIPYKFNERSRMDLLENLRILLAQDKIKIPNDPILLDELRAFQYELTEMGRLRVGVPDNIHDDCVMSLALAVWGAGEAIGKSKENVFLQDSGFYSKQSFD